MPTSSPPRYRALFATLLLSGTLALPAGPALAGAVDTILGGGSSCGVNQSCPGTPGTPVGPTSPIACSPNGAGSPCGSSSGPASQSASGSGQNVGAGNPINVLSGNKYQQEVDLPPLPGVLGLEIVRHYNSQYALPNVPSGILGRGWKLSYETDLYVFARTLQIVQADGTRIIFARDAKKTNLCATDDPARGQIVVQPRAAGDEYVWVWPDGRRLFFDRMGKLTQIVAPTGEFVTLTRDATGALMKVTDPQGRSLQLAYADRRDPAQFHGVTRIDSPLGRFAYAYGSEWPKGASLDALQLKANLTKVTLPAHYEADQKAHPYANRGVTSSAVTRSYHYEDARHPTLLTGITVTGTGSDGQAMQQRISSWAYDADARAVLSVKGPLPTAVAATVSASATTTTTTASTPPRGLEQVNLDFSRTGQTVLTNSLGQKTTYLTAIIAGDYRLLEARGPGCATCGASNVRYRYDGRGRLLVTTTLDALGKPLTAVQTERDAMSRPLKESRYTFVKGKPVAQGWVRYEYAPLPANTANVAPSAETLALPDPQPVLIARPSVVPGQEHQLRLTYNAAGQPLSVTETGFAPALPGAGKAQTQGAEPTPISRTTTYAYQTINGRSLLKEIDGPLPNGPKGDPSDSDVTRMEWDVRGNFQVTVTAPQNRTAQVRYDEVNGRLLSITQRWADVVRRNQYTYSASGAIDQHRQDALTTDGETLLASRVTTYEHNALNQVTAVVWNDGTRTMVHHDPNGLIQPVHLPTGQVLSIPTGVEHVDPSDQESEPVAPESAIASALQAFYGEPGSTAANAVLKFQANGKTALRLLDDFGRVLAIRNPGQGWQTAAYDASDRLVETADATGRRQQVTYNPAGQLLELRRYAAKQATPEEMIAMRWHGPFKDEETVSGADGTVHHRLRYDYNVWGQVTRQDAELAMPTAASPVHLSQTLRYNAAGQLTARILPSGQRIAYRYIANGAAHGALAQIEQIAWPSWLDGLMTRLPERWQPKTILAQPAQPDGKLIDPTGSAVPSPAAQHSRRTYRRPPEAEAGLEDDTFGLKRDADGLPHLVVTVKGRLRLNWNAAHQLVDVSDDLTKQSLAQYRYDAQGRRASKVSPEGNEFYLYEGSQLVDVVREMTPNDRTPRALAHSEFLYQGYRAVAWLNGGTAYRLQSDPRGAITATTSVDEAADRQVLWQSGINAWGAVDETAGDPRFDPRLRLVNQYADRETGWSYNVGRYYDPQRGRFISPDPAGITDSLDEQTPEALKLDTTAYASGQPSTYFDPDGAAKLTYYAITTGPNGQALGSNQGFTKARWAFTIEDVQANGLGGSPAINQLMQTYADNGTGLVFDGKGDFLAAGQKAVTWSGGNSVIIGMFKEHYGSTLISIPQVTINNFSDRDAALLIAALTGNTQSLGYCPYASGLLPEIRFGAEDAPINVTSASANGANKQRILNCTRNQSSTAPMPYANEAERNRVEKYEAAAELTETSKLGKDCSTTGCPGAAITGQTGTVYHASYGRTQFIGSTFLDTINRILSPAEKQVLGVTPDIQQRITAGLRRATKASGAFTKYRSRYTCATAATAWDRAGQATLAPQPAPLTTAERNAFGTDAGLGRQAFIDMICFVPSPPARPLGEGKAAFATEAIFTDTTLKNWMMDIFKSDDKFGLISRVLIRKNLATVLNEQAISANFNNAEAPTLTNGSPNQAYDTRQRAIEEELAMRVARLHNGGTGATSTDTSVLTRNCGASPCDIGNYVKKFIGITASAGDWRSLRCATNPTNGSGAAGTWRGLELTSLSL